eukprot:CAMPEP_0196656116 /NCGR_PEP_ID=MMETSP1086-20130531/13602_1 /TAXON_ID=77921 /ORGANISM="Cyanoptyche  gloeocystis , Strain SAG4.97" /LENGTH=169 /DNA_ID=CAMNT_0041988735 /DNA_START=182 /DNA_END=692 /DNA_ORIENTATION=+
MIRELAGEIFEMLKAESVELQWQVIELRKVFLARILPSLTQLEDNIQLEEIFLGTNGSAHRTVYLNAHLCFQTFHLGRRGGHCRGALSKSFFNGLAVQLVRFGDLHCANVGAVLVNDRKTAANEEVRHLGSVMNRYYTWAQLSDDRNMVWEHAKVPFNAGDGDHVYFLA